MLSSRVMLYRVYENMTGENFEKMKFLLSDRLGKRPTEKCEVSTNPPTLHIVVIVIIIVIILMMNDVCIHNFIFVFCSSKC